MIIGLNKVTTRCSMLPDAGESRQEQGKGATKNSVSRDGSGVPAVVFGRRCMRGVSLPKSVAGGIRVSEVRIPQEGLQDRSISTHRVRGMQTSDFRNSRNRDARYEDTPAGVVQRSLSRDHAYTWLFRSSVSASAGDQIIRNRIPDVT